MSDIIKVPLATELPENPTKGMLFKNGGSLKRRLESGWVSSNNGSWDPVGLQISRWGSYTDDPLDRLVVMSDDSFSLASAPRATDSVTNPDGYGIPTAGVYVDELLTGDFNIDFSVNTWDVASSGNLQFFLLPESLSPDTSYPLGEIASYSVWQSGAPFFRVYNPYQYPSGNAGLSNVFSVNVSRTGSTVTITLTSPNGHTKSRSQTLSGNRYMAFAYGHLHPDATFQNPANDDVKEIIGYTKA